MTAREQLVKELTEAPENLVDELLAVCLETTEIGCPIGD